MPSKFQSRTVALGELLSEPQELRVPDYQRPFSWTVDEATRLLDDITVEIGEQAETESSDHGYFLGSVLLIDADANDSVSDRQRRKFFDIVDGQQRLVTATILLAVIRDITDDRGLPLGRLIDPHIWSSRGTNPQPRLTPRYGEAEFLRAYVQNNGSLSLMPESDELPQSQSRILDVREHLAEALVGYENDDLAILARYLLSSCFLSVITTNSVDRAHRIFTVLNNRGRPLTRNDILKAQILGAIPEDRRPAYTAAWDNIEQRLGPRFELLFSHIRVAEGSGRGRIISGIADLIAASGNAERFFDDVLAPYGDIYATILDCGIAAFPAHAQINRYLTYLNWLTSEDWVPPLMLYWRRTNGAAAGLEAMLRRLDRYAYALRLLGIGADKRLTRFGTILESIRNGTALDGADPAFEFTREDLRNIQFNLRSLHSRSQATCKLILLRLNEVIGGPAGHIDPADYTVEHVLPQKPGRNSEWRTWFRDTEEREECTQSLGNLVLISRGENERARNMDLAKKLQVYFSPEGPQALAITKELAGLTEWRAPAVRERAERFLATLNDMWSLLPPAKQAGSIDPAAPRPPSAQRRRPRSKVG